MIPYGYSLLHLVNVKLPTLVRGIWELTSKAESVLYYRAEKPKVLWNLHSLNLPNEVNGITVVGMQLLRKEE